MECLGTQTLGIGKVTWEGFLTLLGLQLFHTYSRDKTHEKIAGVAFHIDSPCGLCVPIFFQQQSANFPPFGGEPLCLFLGFTLEWV